MKPKLKNNLSCQFSFKGLGTEFYILTSKALSKSLQQQIVGKKDKFEQEFSRFLPSSELSKLNNQKYSINPSQEMLSMLQYALKTYEVTRGLFNISVGGRLEQLDYGLPADNYAKISQNLLEDIKIKKNEVTINENIRLDFGGFGKGWFIDKLGAFLEENNINSYLINGGGDIKVGNQPSLVYIENPLNKDQYIGTATLVNQGFAASSNLKRQWASPLTGKQEQHIVQPNLDQLHSNILMSAVIAKNTLEADILATMLLLTDQHWMYKLASSNAEFCLVGPNLTIKRTANFNLDIS